MTIQITLPSGDTLQCSPQRSIRVLKKEIEKTTGTPWRHQQLFTVTSEKPLGNKEEVSDTSYYLIVRATQAIPDEDILWEMVTKWDEGEIEEEEMERYGSIEDWDVSKVTDMHELFVDCPDMRVDLSEWDVSSVMDMGRMFRGCREFSSDLSGWDVSSVQSMHMMFEGCHRFSSDLSGWDVSEVENMFRMFEECREFSSDLSGWDVSSVQSMNEMFSGSEIKEINNGLPK